MFVLVLMSLLIFINVVSVTMKCEHIQRQEAVQTQITSLRRDIKKLQTDSMSPPPQSLALAAVHTENFITLVQVLLKEKFQQKIAAL